MVKFILGRKLGMSQIFQEDGTVVPVTVIEAEPNVVTQIKTKEKDGYKSVQVGTKSSRPSGRGSPLSGAAKRKTIKREFKPTGEVKVGDKFDVSIFAAGDIVKVSGISKGKGFQGVMKRHGFHGMPHSHGHHHVARHAGSIGQRFPQHTLKGMRMAGRMGGVKATTRGLKVVKVDTENHIVAVKGAIPGNKGGMVIVQSQ